MKIGNTETGNLTKTLGWGIWDGRNDLLLNPGNHMNDQLIHATLVLLIYF